MLRESELKDILREAGCSEECMDEIYSCCISGKQKKADKLIAACRKDQLQLIHNSQICIDRLDYLSWQLRCECPEREGERK